MTVLHGDCLEVLRDLPDGCVTAIVTDPPYGLGFMGKEWDTPGAFVERKSRRRAGSFESVQGNHNPCNSADAARTRGVENRRFQEWTTGWAIEALRVLRPGGHALIFGGTRTHHRLACAVEDAGFEIRDCLMWLYGQGFPKSLDVSKAIDAKLTRGSCRPEDIRRMQAGEEYEPSGRGRRNYDNGGGSKMNGAIGEFAPATDAARLWSGYGTALKPAWEPIILARKPLVGTVAENCQEHGTGALNIDGCRISTSENLNGGAYAKNPTEREKMWGEDAGNSYRRGGAGKFQQPTGRWPANVVLDEEAAALLDEQAPDKGQAAPLKTRNADKMGRTAYGKFEGSPDADFEPHEAPGGASRFMYCAKASKRDRGEGNNHPTVKPVELMRWLVRLVTGPAKDDCLILDPFAGSGTTGVAAQLEGVPFLLIEREAAYVEIIERRLEATECAP